MYNQCDAQVSWCKLEVELASPKNIITASAESQNQEVPPLVVAALNLKTRFNAQVSHMTLAWRQTVNKDTYI